ncbi:TPA: hypothetical protein NR790_002897, partial [Klebsiella pneumoniae]|nr:hypothetical protein [Klebsiella pneumoniae]
MSAQAGHKTSAKLIAQNLAHARWVKNNPSLHYFESILTHFDDLNFLAAYFTLRVITPDVHINVNTGDDMLSLLKKGPSANKVPAEKIQATYGR